LANGTILFTVASKSKSKPSITADPNGLRAEEPDCTGPNVFHSRLAPATAAEDDENPPSVYVAPPTERRMVLPYVC
jgi:hypothetical protein